MKLPPDRFEELVSLYLDNEASDAELRTLVECVKSDPRGCEKVKRICQNTYGDLQAIRQEVPPKKFGGTSSPRTFSRRKTNFFKMP